MLRVDAIRITVNGETSTVQATAETPLLYVLRNDLGLNAARFGCGLGKCGTCTVHLDGVAVHSCKVTLGEVGERPVTTLEGLSPGDDLHPLQQAFLDEQAAQCGYCIPGIIMTTAAFLATTPQPTDAEVREALGGNLCRCGSHTRILRAIRRVIDAGGAS